MNTKEHQLLHNNMQQNTSQPLTLWSSAQCFDPDCDAEWKTIFKHISRVYTFNTDTRDVLNLERKKYEY